MQQVVDKPVSQSELPPAEYGEHAGRLSFWPILLALTLGLVPFGVVTYAYGTRAGLILVAVGAASAIGSMIGWVVGIIREQIPAEEQAKSEKWLRNGLKLFLVSEAAIFGAFFAHYYYMRGHFQTWPPEGAPHLDTTLPAIATLMLMTSSATINRAHRLLLRNSKNASRRWVILTALLGAIFLSIQGYEWGFLRAFDNFTATQGVYGTLFYVMTGFHGLHVATGLILLMLVYVRLRLGHFTVQRHFAFLAATWYWHFVDIVWIFLFGSIYLI